MLVAEAAASGSSTLLTIDPVGVNHPLLEGHFWGLQVLQALIPSGQSPPPPPPLPNMFFTKAPLRMHLFFMMMLTD